MKRYNNRVVAIFIFAMITIFGISCQEDIANVDELRDTNYKNILSTEAPTITAFYEQTDYASSEVPAAITKAELDIYIVVEGENLQGVKSITFNNEQIDMTNVYAQWDMAVFRTPETIPSDIDNNLTYTTELGSTEVALGVILPAAIFSQVENEFTLPGSVTKILGKNFSIYGFDTGRSSIVMYNTVTGYEKTIPVDVAEDTALTITIPADAPDNSLFKFILDDEENAQQFFYRPTTMLLSGSEKVVNSATGTDALVITCTDGSNEGDPYALIPDGLLGSGTPENFFRITGDIAQWKIVMQFPLSNFEFTMPDDKSGNDYEIVYELWTNSANPIPVGSTYKYQLTSTTVYGLWDDFGVNEINTNGEWVTYRSSLNDAMGYVVGAQPTFTDNFIVKLAIAVSGADHAFANFRIQEKMPNSSFTYDEPEVPGVEFTAVENEFQLQGNTTKIIGSNFVFCDFDAADTYIKLVDSDGGEQDITIISIANEALEIEIPATAKDNSLFKFVVDDQEYEQKFHYRPIDYLLFGGSTPTNGAVNGSYAGDTDDCVPCNLIPYAIGDNSEAPKYLLVNGPLDTWKQVMSCSYDIAFEIEDGKEASDYYFVHEFWNDAATPITSANAYKINVNSSGNFLFWEDDGAFDTKGEWVTRRIGLDQIGTLQYGDNTEKFVISTVSALDEAQHAFANFRIEPKLP